MPARFKFRLEPVLEQRERAEEAKRLALAAHERRRLDLEQKLRECQACIEQSRADLRDRLRGGAGSGGSGGHVSLEAVRMQAHASLAMADRANRIVLELAGVHRHLEAARAELLRAQAERKAVELLKSRQRDRWRREIDRQEGNELDDLTVSRTVGRRENP